MLKKTRIKQTALLLTLAYFLLSSHVYMMAGMGEHASGHAAHDQHAAQHVSSFCNWMCGTIFVHSNITVFSQSFRPSFEKQYADTELFFNDPAVFSFYIRPPPVSFTEQT